jgi:hypothetical protein
VSHSQAAAADVDRGSYRRSTWRHSTEDISLAIKLTVDVVGHVGTAVSPSSTSANRSALPPPLKDITDAAPDTSTQDPVDPTVLP